MTASVGIVIILGLLVLIPFSFVGAGCDTERTHASRVQRQREAAMEWTDKDILVAEHTELWQEYYGFARVEEASASSPAINPAPQFAA